MGIPAYLELCLSCIRFNKWCSPKLLGSVSNGLLPGGIPSPPPCPGWLILAAICNKMKCWHEWQCLQAKLALLKELGNMYCSSLINSQRKSEYGWYIVTWLPFFPLTLQKNIEIYITGTTFHHFQKHAFLPNMIDSILPSQSLASPSLCMKNFNHHFFLSCHPFFGFNLEFECPVNSYGSDEPVTSPSHILPG